MRYMLIHQETTIRLINKNTIISMKKQSIDLADMIVYKISNKKKLRYIFDIFDNFWKYTWCIPLKKNAQAITDEILKILITSKRKPFKRETERWLEFYNSIFQNSLKINNTHHYRKFSDKCPSISKRVIRTIRNLQEKPVFQKGSVSWISQLPSITKKCNNTVHHSIKLTPFQASSKKNEKKCLTISKTKEKNINQNSIWQT